MSVQIYAQRFHFYISQTNTKIHAIIYHYTVRSWKKHEYLY